MRRPASVGDGPEDEALRVLFEGPHAKLSLVFDPTSFVPGPDPEVWPRAMVAFEGGGLSGAAVVSFFPGSLPEFARDLATAHSDLRGTATLESEDGDFRLAAAFGDRGDATLTGHLQPNVLNGTRLVYEIVTDQSYFDASLTALRDLGL